MKPGGSRPKSLTIGVFAKHWTPGKTKTRLAASIGTEASAEVSRRFLIATLERLRDDRLGEARHVVVYTPACEGEAFASLHGVASGDWHHEPQSEGTLGERMRCFFEEALQQGSAALLVGTDSPDLPLQAVAEGMRWLSNGDGHSSRLVLGPTDDGGYWLIGARGKLPPIFDEMPWSQPTLMQATVERLDESGWREGDDYCLLSPWYDVDEAADLDRLRSGLRQGDPALKRLADELDALLGPN